MGTNFITSKQLKGMGFTDTNINELLGNNILKINDANSFVIINYNKLYDLAISNFKSGDYKKGRRLLLVCNRVLPFHHEQIFGLFFTSIEAFNYRRAMEYLRLLYNTNNADRINEYNLYLYLINYIVEEIPNFFKARAKYITLEDVTVSADDSRYSNIFAQNNLRRFIIDQEFTEAKELLEKIDEKHPHSRIQKLLLDSLLTMAYEKKVKIEHILHNYITNQKYDELITFLKGQKTRRLLDIYEIYCLKLSKKILQIQDTPFSTVFAAIDKEAYSTALAMINDDENDLPFNKNLTILLSNLVAKLHKINLLSSNKFEPARLNQDNDYTPIINLLITGDYDQAIELLKQFLSDIDKRDYENYFINLLKISFYENDDTFSQISSGFESLLNNTFKFNEENVLYMFNKYLDEENFVLAELYCNIIIEMVLLNHSNISISDIKNKLLSDFDKDITKKEPEVIAVSRDKLADNLISSYQVPSIKEQIQSVIENKSSVILSNIFESDLSQIQELLVNYPNINPIVIKKDGKKTLLLQYYNKEEASLPFGILSTKAKRAFEQNNYLKCIELFSELISTVKNVHSSNYHMLGMSYLRTGQPELDLYYLSIALGMNEMTPNINPSFKNFVEKLEKDIEKGKVRENSRDRFYTVPSFPEIKAMFFEQNKNIDQIGQEFELTEEQIQLVLILLAREVYADNDIIFGDKIIQALEKRPNKSSFVRKQIDETRANKMFYKNRYRGDDNQYIIQ